MYNKLLHVAGVCSAKELSGIDHGDWQDASASVGDHALQAAVAGGVVTFVHAAAGMQEKLKQAVMPCTKDTAAGRVHQDSVAASESKENRSPVGLQHKETIDDVTCLELE